MLYLCTCYKTEQTLLQNGTIFLLQIGAKTYYKSGLLFHYILGQIYYNLGQLLQIGAGITYWDNYYKLVHNSNHPLYKSVVESRKFEGYCSFKGAYFFHRTSCSNFCSKSTELNTRKHLRPFLFFHDRCAHLTISEQQFQLLIKYSKLFRRAIVDICCYDGDFRKSYFFQSTALSEDLVQP